MIMIGAAKLALLACRANPLASWGRSAESNGGGPSFIMGGIRANRLPILSFDRNYLVAALSDLAVGGY